MRVELQNVLSAVREMAPEQLPQLLGELEVVRATAIMRLTAPAPAPQSDKLLDVEEAAERLGVSTGYLYQNHKALPFARKMGKRVLFSSLGLERYIKQQMR